MRSEAVGTAGAGSPWVTLMVTALVTVPLRPMAAVDHFLMCGMVATNHQLPIGMVLNATGAAATAVACMWRRVTWTTMVTMILFAAWVGRVEVGLSSTRDLHRVCRRGPTVMRFRP